MRTMLILFLLFAGFILKAENKKGDIERGKKVYLNSRVNCTQCHKADGSGYAKKASELKTVRGPRISGLPIEYSVEQMTKIQGKDRKTARRTRFTATMKSRIRRLSEQDILDVATYIHSLGKEYKSEIWPR